MPYLVNKAEISVEEVRRGKFPTHKPEVQAPHTEESKQNARMGHLVSVCVVLVQICRRMK